MTALHYASLFEVCQRLKSGELRSEAVTAAMLERIAAHDGGLGSYACVLAERALAAAAALDQRRQDGQPLGLLHGVPLAVKDLLDIKGVVTASGTRVMRDLVAERDAAVVARLEASGAVIIGKTQLTEGAFAAHHPAVEPPRNPWDQARWPGVSSSGSGVSVAGGFAYAALGSDTGGSIRFPSASCGVVGLKPTFGRVSKQGAFPLADSLDHIGPMARSVGDVARVLQVIAGHDPADPHSLPAEVPNYLEQLHRGVEGLRVGVDWGYVERGVQAEVIRSVQDAADTLQQLGAELVETTLPPYQRLVDGWSATCGVECARAHQEYFPAQANQYGGALAALIRLGLSTLPQDYERMQQTRQAFTQRLNALFESVDLLLTPSMPCLPPLQADMEGGSARADNGEAELITFTAPFNYSGHPTLSVPAGLTNEGLPTSVQLVASHLGEPTLVRAGDALERVLALELRPIA